MAMPEFAELSLRVRGDELTVWVEGKALGTVETDKDGKVLIRPYQKCLARQDVSNG